MNLYEEREKPGSSFSVSSVSSLEDVTGELLSYAVKQSTLERQEVINILAQSVQLITYIASMGHTCKLPHGVMGIVLLPEVDEFSNVGLRSKLFWKERVVLGSFHKEMEEWGYENIPSGKINRALRKKLSVKGCATKIQKANETSLLRYNHFKGSGEHGE